MNPGERRLALGIAGAVVCQAPLKVILHMSFGTLSHIKPLLEMGTVLRGRNHTVVYAAFDVHEKFNKPYQFQFTSLGRFGDDLAQRAMMKKLLSEREMHDPIKSIPKTFGTIAPAAYDATYPALSKAVNEEKPDVIICDFFSSACRDLAEMKGIPLITGFQSTDMFGIATSPFITSSMTYGSVTTDNLNFIQRFQDKVITPFQMTYSFNQMINNMNKERAKYGVPPASLPFGDFSTSLGLANTFEGLEAASPIPPYIKMVGPIKSDSYSPLTPELAKFLENRPRTLYIAFGSAVVLADFDVENLVVGALTALADGSIDGILWGLGKTTAEDFPETFKINDIEITREELFDNKHPNIQLLPWAPQTAILEHKNTRLFVSHGGLESTVEAILSGTPVLCMPFFGDQPRNARKLEDAGVGKYINRLVATPATVASDIRYMMVDESGRIAANVKRMRTIAQFGSHRKELGANAIEEYAFTAQACRPLYPQTYGQVPCELSHLTMASRNMPFIKATLIDVYGFAIFIVLATTSISGYAMWRLVRSQYSRSIKHIAKKEQ